MNFTLHIPFSITSIQLNLTLPLNKSKMSASNPIIVKTPMGSMPLPVPYNPEWAHQFNSLKAELEQALTGLNYTSIEHVGSTSVPGLTAKPVIDIDIIIPDPSSLPPIITALATTLSYEYFGEMGIVDRHAFRCRGAVPTRNLYVCIVGSMSLRNHLGLRDVLRRDESLREEYGRVKVALIEGGVRDIDAYIAGKSEVLQRILKESGRMTESELEEIEKANRGDQWRKERVKVNPAWADGAVAGRDLGKSV
jgi:GrpB-like predicted nucleotidyltransferase (UPF0157 family)